RAHQFLDLGERERRLRAPTRRSARFGSFEREQLVDCVDARLTQPDRLFDRVNVALALLAQRLDVYLGEDLIKRVGVSHADTLANQTLVLETGLGAIRPTCGSGLFRR